MSGWYPNAELCPPVIVESLKAYVQGRPTGSFLRAVLENDLRGAIGRADYINGPALGHIVAYCYNNIPSGSWGSPERVEKWLADRRAEKEIA